MLSDTPLRDLVFCSQRFVTARHIRMRELKLCVWSQLESFGVVCFIPFSFKGLAETRKYWTQFDMQMRSPISSLRTCLQSMTSIGQTTTKILQACSNFATNMGRYHPPCPSEGCLWYGTREARSELSRTVYIGICTALRRLWRHLSTMMHVWRCLKHVWRCRWRHSSTKMHVWIYLKYVGFITSP